MKTPKQIARENHADPTPDLLGMLKEAQNDGYGQAIDDAVKAILKHQIGGMGGFATRDSIAAAIRCLWD